MPQNLGFGKIAQNSPGERMYGIGKVRWKQSSLRERRVWAYAPRALYRSFGCQQLVLDSSGRPHRVDKRSEGENPGCIGSVLVAGDLHRSGKDAGILQEERRAC